MVRFCAAIAPRRERARELALGLDNPVRTAGACVALGKLYAKAGDRQQEDARFAEALALVESPGREHWLAMTLLNRGVVRRETGRLEEAQADLTRSLEIVRRIGHALGEADALDDLGALHLELRQYGQAMAFQKEGLAIALERKDLHREASVRQRLGVTLAARGRVAEARQEWRRALTIRERHGIGDADEIRRLLGIQTD